MQAGYIKKVKTVVVPHIVVPTSFLDTLKSWRQLGQWHSTQQFPPHSLPSSPLSQGKPHHRTTLLISMISNICMVFYMHVLHHTLADARRTCQCTQCHSDYTHGRPYVQTNEAWYTAEVRVRVRVRIYTRPGVCIVTDFFIHTAGRVYNISRQCTVHALFCV